MELKERTAGAVVLLVLASWACNEMPPAPSSMPDPIPLSTPAPTEEPAVESAKVNLPAPSVEAAPLPENLEIDEEGFFSLDTVTQEFPLTLAGSDTMSLVGRLASPEGKREIVLVLRGGEEEVVFSADWLLPAAGAVSGSGDLLVCVNRLTGKPTALTEGKMPDPRQGVELACRMRTADGWQREVLLPRGDGAHWLIKLTARRDHSFWVAFSRDKSGLMVSDPEPGDGIYRVAFKDGAFGASKLVRSWPLPPEARDE